MVSFYYRIEHEFLKLYFLEEPCEVILYKNRDKLKLIGEVELMWDVNDSYLEEVIGFALECAMPSLQSRLPFAAQQVGSDKVIRGMYGPGRNTVVVFDYIHYNALND